MKEDGQSDLEDNSYHLKVRYSIENYEKLLVTVEEMRKRLERVEEDRLVKEESRGKVA